MLAEVKRFIGYVPGVRSLRRTVYSWIYGLRLDVPVSRPRERGEQPGCDRDGLLSKYNCPEGDNQKSDFVLYRVIGNDLYPRHRKGQSRENLKFILENEPDLEGCEKRFVVNRVVDPGEERKILDMLADAGMEYIHIPFRWDEYRRVPWDIDGVPVEYLHSRAFPMLNVSQQGGILMRLYRHKNNYVMNNNGARNVALHDGRRHGRWVLPWDGNCFLTPQAWAEIRSAVVDKPELPYRLVPMARITDNRLLLDDGVRPVPDQEPQVIFRSDAKLVFDERFFYGRRPKVSLFWELGVPGPWADYVIEPWDLPCPEYSDDAGCFESAGWVARLNSGRHEQEVGKGASSKRYRFRSAAVIDMLSSLDVQSISAKSREAGAFALYNPTLLQGASSSVGRDDAGLADDVAACLRLYAGVENGNEAPGALRHCVAHIARHVLRNPLVSGRLRKRFNASEVPVFLSALEVLRCHESVLDKSVLSKLQEGLRRQQNRLLSGKWGAVGHGAAGAVGAAYEGAVFSLASYLKNWSVMSGCLRSSRERLAATVRDDGFRRPIGELVYWVLLARLLESAGDDLWNFEYGGEVVLRACLHGSLIESGSASAALPLRAFLSRAYSHAYGRLPIDEDTVVTISGGQDCSPLPPVWGAIFEPMRNEIVS